MHKTACFKLPPVIGVRSSLHRDFNLYNVVFDPVNDILIDARLIGKFVECQAVCSGKSKNFFIPPGKSVKGSFVEGLQIASAGSRVKIRLAGQERSLDKESGILVIFAGKPTCLSQGFPWGSAVRRWQQGLDIL